MTEKELQELIQSRIYSLMQYYREDILTERGIKDVEENDTILSFSMTADEFEENLIKIQELRTTWRKELLEVKKRKKNAELILEETDRIEEKLRSGYKKQLDEEDSKRQD